MNDMHNYTDFIRGLQSKGIYVFSKKDLLAKTNIQEGSAKVTLARNIKLGNIVYIGQHLYLIIPPEYKSMKSPPPEWYVHDLMKAHKCHYYVGLLTAAAFHGAAHQAPQVFQIICDKRLPEVIIGNAKIQFYYSRMVSQLPLQERNTPTGYLNVSTPEVTAFDLIKYMRQSGHINHVATVLTELGENIKARDLKKAALFYSPAYIQRLGYMLDELGHSDKTSLLNNFIKKQPLRYVYLRSDGPKNTFPKNEKWHVLINEKLEPDI